MGCSQGGNCSLGLLVYSQWALVYSLWSVGWNCSLACWLGGGCILGAEVQQGQSKIKDIYLIKKIVFASKAGTYAKI